MLESCFGLPLSKGTSIVAIVNSIASICYILYYIWQFNTDYGYTAQATVTDEQTSSPISKSNPQILNEVFFNYITLVFILVGSTSLFANFGLFQATLKNETHKIYLWLVISYVQFGTVVAFEILVLSTVHVVKHIIGQAICYILLDAILAFQMLVVQSFYVEEKLVEKTHYTRLSSELTSQQLEEQVQQKDEFQDVEL